MIMLNEYLKKVKDWIEGNKKDLYIAAIIFLVSLASFGLGRLSVLWPTKEPIKITEQEPKITNQEEVTKETTVSNPFNFGSVRLSSKGKYVASKSGRSYHFPWCAGALKIKEENKIWFESKEEAEKAGYKPAGNCEGL